MKYQIEYSMTARGHLRDMTGRERATVLKEVDRQLEHHPLTESKNCRQMRQNPIAGWRLRLGDLRVYFDVSDADKMVYIQAVGIKIGSLVSIGGEIFEL